MDQAVKAFEEAQGHELGHSEDYKMDQAIILKRLKSNLSVNIFNLDAYNSCPSSQSIIRVILGNV